jgi:hypothetical protein
LTTIANNKITLTDKTTAPSAVGELVRNGNNLYYHDGTTSTQLDASTSVANLNDITNVTITSNSTGEILKWNGSAWVNNTLAEADIGTATAVALNTAKTGITAGQASAITANTAKTGITSGQASAITANTAKVTNATHTGDVTGSTALAIGSNKITKSMIQTSAKTEALIIAAGDETTVIDVADGKTEFQMPYAFTLTEVRATLTTAGTTSGVTTIDIEDDGATIFSTLLTIDSTEKTSTSAATPAVISGATLADGSIMKVNVDVISGGATEAGLKIYLIGYQT